MSYPNSDQKLFKSSEFADPIVEPGVQSPYRDSEHFPETCLACAAGPVLINGGGLWRLRTPLLISNLMSGTNKRITSITTKGGSTWQTGTIIFEAFSNLALEADGQEVFRGNKLSHDPIPNYANNAFLNLNINVDDRTSLDVKLEQWLRIYAGYAAHHDFDITVAYAWMSDIPPETGDIEIRITSAQTGSPIPNAFVRLLKGAAVERQAYTNSQGIVSWINVNAGSYTAQIYEIPASLWSDGYEERTEPVDVIANQLATYTIPLVPILKIPIIPSLPWYAWAAIPVAAVGAYTLFKRPQLPVVIVSGISERLRPKPS